MRNILKSDSGILSKKINLQTFVENIRLKLYKYK